MGRGAVRAKERAAAAERRAAAGDRAMFVAKEDLQNNNNTKLVQKKVDKTVAKQETSLSRVKSGAQTYRYPKSYMDDRRDYLEIRAIKH